MAVRFPKILKESTYRFRAFHDLKGITTHPEAEGGKHSHDWVVTLIFEHEFNCKHGFWRDEVEIDRKWGERLMQLDGVNLTEFMSLPATAENVAFWLLYFWMTGIDSNQLNYELSGVRISKSVDGGLGRHSCEVRRTGANRTAWEAFDGEIK